MELKAELKKSLISRRVVMVAVVLAITVMGVVIDKPGEMVQQAAAATDYRQLQKFSRVMEMIRSAYVEEVTDETLVDGALSGMLSNLDPHSAYLNKEMYSQMQVDTRGKFGGLGIEIVAAEGGIRVVTPIEDTPADRAGIKAGDLIIKINDELAKDMTLPEAVKKMRGKPGSSIRLTVFRESAAAKGPLEFAIVRAVIQVKSVKADLLAPGYAYLRITQFQEKTDALLKKKIAEMKKRAKGTLHGAVLDLRNNPGGLLDQAVAVSDLFLDKGGIVSTKSRAGKNLSFSANRGDALRGLSLVVLINQGSASASEIVAGALQDNHRAVLIGTQSFGKGSVQSVVPLNDGTAFKLTTALYFTPSGRSIQATGIAPDIIVEQVQVAAAGKDARSKFSSISERDLKGHLKNGNTKKAKRPNEGEASEAMQKRLSRDVQLQRALDLLKGLNALHSKSS